MTDPIEIAAPDCPAEMVAVRDACARELGLDLAVVFRRNDSGNVERGAEAAPHMARYGKLTVHTAWHDRVFGSHTRPEFVDVAVPRVRRADAARAALSAAKSQRDKRNRREVAA